MTVGSHDKLEYSVEGCHCKYCEVFGTPIRPEPSGILDSNPNMSDGAFEKVKKMMKAHFEKNGMLLVTVGNITWVEKSGEAVERC